MKSVRAFFVVCAIGLLSACARVETTKKSVTAIESTEAVTEKATEKVNEKAIEPVTVKKEPNYCSVDRINFYLYGGGKRTLVNGYEGPFVQGKDIVEYQIFYTDEAVIDGGYFKTVWEGYRDSYTGAKDFKIGYEISFDVTEDGKKSTVHKFIFSPKDTESYFEYLQTWMYDDSHKAQGQWYSHVTEDEMTDEVRLTAIKFTGGDKIDKVGDDITLTVFLYKDDKDFSDDKTEFIGTCKKTIHYLRKD